MGPQGDTAAHKGAYWAHTADKGAHRGAHRSGDSTSASLLDTIDAARETPGRTEERGKVEVATNQARSDEEVFRPIWASVLKVDSLRGGLAKGNRIFQSSTFYETLPSPLGWFGDNMGT